ncbi:hypothetical protein [Streptomyces sp. NPDC058157]|uniref:hypothetical protein n=1 Tax=Streptomyces sp. NPDC058157 TaxID=3346360 RepID=UPI0036E821EF
MTTPPSRPTGPDYVRVGATVFPRWLPWLVAVLVVAGGGSTAVLLARAPDPGHGGQAAGPPSQSPAWSPGTQPPVPPAATETSTPQPPSPTPPPATHPAPEPTPPPPAADDPAEVVEEYYRDLANRDFDAAWELGGKYIAHTTFGNWVSGYDSTAALSLASAGTEGGGRVRVLIRALQTDGTLKTYGGTYTVSGGVIVSASVTEQ